MPEHKDFIAIGKITKTIGIKGNLKIIPLTDFPERFIDLEKLTLYNEAENKFFENKLNGNYEFTISECKVFPDYINLRFEYYITIESAKELVNLILMIDEKKRIKLQKGSYYNYELVGSEVFDKGEKIGDLVSIVNYGSGDLFNIKHKDKEILIPYRDEFVKKIDPGKKRIDVELIDGFLEN